MGLPMDEPYRGFAEVTHDTNRIAEVIAELNQLNADVVAKDIAQDAAIAAAGSGSYAPSASVYWVESMNDGGGSQIQSISSGFNTLLDLGSGWNNGGGFNATSDSYTIPAYGTYVTMATVRVADNYGVSCDVGLSFHVNSTMSTYTTWYQHVDPVGLAGGLSRHTFSYMRIGTYSAGNVFRLYMYQDSGSNMPLWTIWMVTYCIG